MQLSKYFKEKKNPGEKDIFRKELKSSVGSLLMNSTHHTQAFPCTPAASTGKCKGTKCKETTFEFLRVSWEGIKHSRKAV